MQRCIRFKAFYCLPIVFSSALLHTLCIYELTDGAECNGWSEKKVDRTCLHSDYYLGSYCEYTGLVENGNFQNENTAPKIVLVTVPWVKCWLRSATGHLYQV